LIGLGLLSFYHHLSLTLCSESGARQLAILHTKLPRVLRTRYQVCKTLSDTRR